MARIVVAAVPIPGHVAPLRRIAADLTARGHDVTSVTGSQFVAEVEGAGLRFVPLSGIADYPPSRQAEVLHGRGELPPGPAQLNHDFTKVFYEPVPDQHDTIQRVLAEAPDTPTVIITDQSFMGHWPVRLGAPGILPHAFIGIGVVPLSLNSVDTAPFGLGLPPDASPGGRLRNLEQNRMVEAMFGESTEILRKTLSGLGAGADIGFPMDAIVTLPDRFLQLAIPEVEYPRSDLPDGFRYIGALPPEPAGPQSLPPWWDDVLASDGVVLVTQGTVANRDLGQLIEPAIEALADLDRVVVVTTGHDDAALGPVPANVRVADYVPYSALLPHTDLVITNGGYGGCLQALDAGIPLVIAGRTEDKIEVAARLAWTGAAIDLGTDAPEPAAILAAALAVLLEPGCRQHAQRLRVAGLSYQPFDEIAKAIDELL
jgi:UDP:flavonoid glycosyltransferase YjiC (YdhE family)